jgi:hypothetical protein
MPAAKGDEQNVCPRKHGSARIVTDSRPPRNVVPPISTTTPGRALPRDRGSERWSSCLARLDGQVINFSYDFDHGQLRPELAGDCINETGNKRDNLNPGV